MIPAILPAIVLALTATTAMAGPPTDTHRSRVRQLLLAKNGFPSAKLIMRTGPMAATNRAIAEIALQRNERPRMRLNAIRALEYFPTRRSEEVLMSLLYAKHQKPAFKKTCLRALARAFGVRMYFEILPFLRDENATTRAGAATALGEIEDGRVKGILANHLVHEQELMVRMAIEKAIEMIDERARRAARIRAGEL